MVKEIFELCAQNSSGSEYGFTSEKDLNNIEAMQVWIEENGLEDFVVEDDGTLLFLEHPDYGFQVAVESYGLGDFFTHGISVNRAS